MPRLLARAFFVLLCAALAAGLGVVSALLGTPAGRALLARLLTDQAPRLVRGSVHIGGVEGPWVDGLALDSVVIRDTSGVLVAEVPRLRVSYHLSDLLAGRFIFSSALLERPVLQVIKHRSGRLNYEEVFRLNEGGGQGGVKRAPLIEIRGVRVTGGRLTIRLPWHPDGRIHTARQVDSALAFERARPGRRIENGAEGLEMVRTIEGLETGMPVFRISTPDHQPVMIQIERLAARLSDPAIEIRDLRGLVRTKDDSLLFDLDHAELPGTSVRGSGRLDWPRDTILYHFSFQAPRLSLADLRWVSPQFPDFTGAARVRAQSTSGARTEFDIRDLSVGDSSSRVSGRLVAITDVYRGLGFRGLALSLTNLDLDVVRPYLDSLPFHGRLTGRLGADGFFDDMTISLDWQFHDARVEGGAESRLALDGRVKLGGADGMYFDGARLSDSDVDLRTVRLVAPAVILEGGLRLAGTLTGPWKNVVFDGTAEHRDGERPPSRLQGRVRLDTRGSVLGLEADVVLDSLRFDGIRRTFPTLTANGGLGGRLKLGGSLDRLSIDADLAGGLGGIAAHGRATLTPPRWGADSLLLRFARLDLAELTGGGPHTQLQGTLEASGVIDSAAAPSGHATLRLGSGRIREFRLDSAAAAVHAADSLITLDTLQGFWDAGRVDGGGSLGWMPPKSGRMAFHAEARDLAAFDSLALGLTGLTRDTTIGDREMSGRARGDLVLDGALGALTLKGNAEVEPFNWLGYRAVHLRGELGWATPGPALDAVVSADSLGVRELIFTRLSGRVRGRPDSLQWLASGAGKGVTHAGAGGRLVRRPEGRMLHADSLDLDLGGRSWRLAAPFDMRLRDSTVWLDTARLATTDGSGSVELAGTTPGRADGDLTLTALGVYLVDLYALAQHDTAGIRGTVTLDARLGGSARSPTLRGTGALTGPVFGDFQAPLIRTAFDYREGLLRSNLTFWRTGKPFLQVDASLPLDLALQGATRRELPGPLSIIASGDSIDLALAEAFTPNLRKVTGLFDLDARVEGSWDAPRLAGHARIRDGGADVPGLGVRYGPVTGGIRFNSDSMVADGVTIGGRTGELTVSGGLRLERLTQPVLGFHLAARDFELINVEDYLKLRATGDIRLTGPLMHPTMTGRASLSNSVIYFADLVTKDIVNLEDPLNADLVDTLALRRQDLRANFQSRFLDSLTIRDLEFSVGDAVWLRSNEANFQLEGRVRVNKTRRLYRMDGVLDTPRGTYTLKVGGVINRPFTVERGTVRYFGNLNAELDVQARHLVKMPQGSGSDIPVIVRITGTLAVPKLELTTPPDRPPMSEPQLISLLMLGTTDPTAAQFGNTDQKVQAAVALAANALSSELQRALISESGAFDVVEIRPGLATSGLVGRATSTPTQFAVGRALTSKLFVTANAGLCLNSGQSGFSARNLGASLEYRFSRPLRFLISAEPVQSCFARVADAFATTKRYQFGAELRWDHDY